MIIYNEKSPEDEPPTPTPAPPPTHNNPLASPISSVDSRLGAGLLHQYLQIYKDQVEQGRRPPGAPNRQNSDDTAVDLEEGAAHSTVPVDEPPPYSAEDTTKVQSPPPSLEVHSPRSPSPPYQPVAGPSTYGHHNSVPWTGDIDEAWSFEHEGEEDASTTTPDSDSCSGAAARPPDKVFETLRGDIRLAVTSPAKRRRGRPRVDAIAHSGSISITLSRPQSAVSLFRSSIIDLPPSPFSSIYIHAHSKGAISITLPPGFTGVLRVLHPTTPPTIDPALEPITLISRCATETQFFVGDVRAAGYVKGADWTGDLVEAQAGGSVSLLLGSSTTTANCGAAAEEEKKERGWTGAAVDALRTFFTVPALWSFPF